MTNPEEPERTLDVKPGDVIPAPGPENADIATPEHDDDNLDDDKHTAHRGDVVGEERTKE